MFFAANILAAALIGVGLLIRAAVRELRRSLRDIAAELEAARAGPEAHFSQRLLELETMVDTLPQRWEQIKREATRAEGRARAIVADARRELAASGLSSPAVDEQARELRLVDGEGGRGEAMPAVHQNVEGSAPAAQDWRAAGIARKFGG